MGSSGGACKPDCTCGRHHAKHKPDCRCNRCPRRPKPVEEQAKRKDEVITVAKRSINPDMCVCKHMRDRHDPFGCKTCESNIQHGHARARPCHQFRSRAGYAIRADHSTYEREVRREGFIRHIGDLATCTDCWQSVKLGAANTLTSVISARAHNQLCKGHVRPAKGTG